MNRISESAYLVQSLFDGNAASAPIEALVIDRERLIRVLKNALYELHTERHHTGGMPVNAEIVQRIRYLDEILGWVKEQPPELVVMGRR